LSLNHKVVVVIFALLLQIYFILYIFCNIYALFDLVPSCVLSESNSALNYLRGIIAIPLGECTECLSYAKSEVIRRRQGTERKARLKFTQ
jgi:hypothetical protein